MPPMRVGVGRWGWESDGGQGEGEGVQLAMRVMEEVVVSERISE